MIKEMKQVQSVKMKKMNKNKRGADKMLALYTDPPQESANSHAFWLRRRGMKSNLKFATR